MPGAGDAIIVAFRPEISDRATGPGEDAQSAIRWVEAELAKNGDTADQRRRLLKSLCSKPDASDAGHSLQHHPWQQPLRLLNHNWETLNAVYFVLTPEVTTSGQYSWFVQLINLLKRPGEIEILPAEHTAMR